MEKDLENVKSEHDCSLDLIMQSNKMLKQQLDKQLEENLQVKQTLQCIKDDLKEDIFFISDVLIK